MCLCKQTIETVDLAQMMAVYSPTVDDEALARALQEQEDAECHSTDEHLAQRLQDKSRQELQEADMVAAVRQQKQEEWGFHSVQREDTKFAMSLYNGEVTGKLQDEICDEEIAKQLHEAEQENSEQTTFVDMEIDQSDADIPDGQADEDFKFALEVNDREVACRLQVELDKKVAEALAKEDQSTVNSGDMGRNPETQPIPDFGREVAFQPPKPPLGWAFHQRNDAHRGNPRARPNNRPRNRRNEARGGPSREQGDGAIEIPDPDDYEANWELAERLGEVKDRSLPKEQQDALPTCNYTGGAANSSEEDKACKICLGEFEAGDKLKILPCTHKYHDTCIENWFKTNCTCPICKLDVKEELSKA